MHNRYARHLAGAVGAAFVFSSVYYVGLDTARTDLLQAAGTTISEPAPWLMMLEPVRTLVIAIAIGAAVRRLGVTTRAQAIRLALATFAAFPAMLLLGSVIHGESPTGLAAIHAGDWIVKLILIALVMRRFHATPRTATTINHLPADRHSALSR